MSATTGTSVRSGAAVANSSAIQLDPRAYDRALSCVHCGLCLPACPTYTTTLHEADSPRGRIQLIRALADGSIELSQSAQTHLALCLDCRGCETACPSGVIYHELIEDFRTRVMPPERSPEARLVDALSLHVFPYARRLKLLLLPVRLLQKAGLYSLLRHSGLLRRLPGQLRKMEQMLPASGALWPRALPARTAPTAPTAARTNVRTVGFFSGCIGSVVYDRTNRRAVELLAACGAEVVTPPNQVCCGAIHHHNGRLATARDLARRNIDLFMPVRGQQVDLIATDIAGCGAMLREYDVLLRDDKAYAGRARTFASRVRDISEVLLELGPPEMKHPVNAVAVYHDACHLAHAQKVTDPPRRLLGLIPALKLVALAESDMCCGAAGTYNLTQPQMSSELAARKLAHIAASGASMCIAGNVGCAMQIQSEADARGQRLQVVHPVDLLHRAVFGGDRHKDGTTGGADAL